MTDSIDPTPKVQIDGECQLCGFPGIIGLTCSECGGNVIAINDEKPQAKTEDEDGRYDDDDLLEDDKVVSLEDLADEEETDKPDSFDDDETL